MQYRTASPDDTAAFGAALGENLRPGDTALLTGDLGAGKSVLARGIARGAGVRGAMPSPTFTLMQPYTGKCPFYHFDLYRLADEDEFWQAGLDEYIASDGIAVVEWPDRADLSCDNAIDIRIDPCPPDDAARRITLAFSGFEGRLDGILASLAPWRET